MTNVVAFIPRCRASDPLQGHAEIITFDQSRRGTMRGKVQWEHRIASIPSSPEFAAALCRGATRHNLQILYCREETGHISFKIEGLPHNIARFKRGVENALTVINF